MREKNQRKALRGRHAVTLVWISSDLVKRKQKWMKSGNIKDGNVTCLWKNNKAIAHFIGLV